MYLCQKQKRIVSKKIITIKNKTIMKKYLFLALGVAALTSCSSDEVTELNQGNEIKFAVVADNDSRAADIYCNNNLMEDFTLYASTDQNKDFIVAETYENDGNSTSYTTGDEGSVRYWPENDALNFYAIKNAELDWEAGQAPTGDFTVAPTVGAQVDFVYSVERSDDNTGVTKDETNNGTVTLNFRHALSQIEFQAKNENPDLWVEILNVKVGNAKSEGDFTFPNVSTKDNYENHTGAVTPNEEAGVITWTNQATPENYKLDADLSSPVTLLSTQGVQPITYVQEDLTTYTNSMLLLPQTTAKWNGTEGSFLAVKCRIWNIIGGDTNTKVLLYGDANGDGTAEGRWAFVPVDFSWAPGCKYIYTFNFTKGGNAGFDDSAGEEKPSNIPVLVNLTVDVTVDDFEPKAPTNTPMEVEPFDLNP